jgi:hypothetical protein
MLCLEDFSCEKTFPQYGQVILSLFPKFRKISGCFELKDPPSHEIFFELTREFSKFLKFV